MQLSTFEQDFVVYIKKSSFFFKTISQEGDNKSKYSFSLCWVLVLRTKFPHYTVISRGYLNYVIFPDLDRST